ncbi:MAG: hypothetical protein LRS49_06315 [Desulfurococcales archaeon]|nr:hypothetical protein [Desulfurococcales archaeon]
MGSREYGVGRILVVCERCGFKYHVYALGDPGNRAKYSGPPTIDQALSGHGGACPRCGYRPSRRPVRIEIMSRAEFEATHVETKYFVVRRDKLEEIIAGVAPAGAPEALPLPATPTGAAGIHVAEPAAPAGEGLEGA